MATGLIPVKSSTALGRELLDTMEAFSDSFARLKRLFAAMGQEKDGDGSQASHFAVNTQVFGFVDTSGVASNDSAKASYDELNSLVGNHAAAIEQICAKHKQ